MVLKTQIREEDKYNTNILWWVLLISAFLAEIFVWWPGILRPDSIEQLSQAQAGSFSGDHHPPIMAMYWYLLHLLYPEPGLMFFTHLSLLFGAVIFFSRCFEGPIKWLFIAIPFFPPVLSLTGFIVKDMSFAFSYLFCMAALAFYTIRKKPLGSFALGGLMLVLFYGTAVKYQGIFLLPVLSFWAAYCTNPSQRKFKTCIKGISIWGALWASVTLFNHWAIPHKDHSWQLVKLYDLAAISLETGEDFIPSFNKRPGFSKERLSKEFNPARVDELVWSTAPLLCKGENEEERSSLWHTWLKTVLTHPGAYLKHRYRLGKIMLSLSPIKPLHEIRSHEATISVPIKIIMHFLEKWNLIGFLQSITTFYIYMPCVLFYIGLGLTTYRRTGSPYGLCLVTMNGTALLLTLVLFIFSMASDVRYVYLSVCCFHFSHPFMIRCWQDLRNRVKLKSWNRKA
jgi:hypothetical protein